MDNLFFYTTCDSLKSRFDEKRSVFEDEKGNSIFDYEIIQVVDNGPERAKQLIFKRVGERTVVTDVHVAFGAKVTFKHYLGDQLVLSKNLEFINSVAKMELQKDGVNTWVRVFFSASGSRLDTPADYRLAGYPPVFFAFNDSVHRLIMEKKVVF